METKSYAIISDYYKDKSAKRSGVPYMNHIDEGLIILNALGASQVTKDAYCLHPIFQDISWDYPGIGVGLRGVSLKSNLLAAEYARVANSFLSHMSIDNFVGITNEEIRQMLIADKVQNYKDFMSHHQQHPKFEQLYVYFHKWFDILEIDVQQQLNILKCHTL